MAANNGNGNTPIRHIRVPNDVWLAALEAAHENGTSVAAILNATLRRYVKRHGGKANP